MSRHIRPRPPIDLPQTDLNSCRSCVAAQLLYMFGLQPQPDVTAVDRQIKRHPGQIADSLSLFYMLLGAGLKAHTICAYDYEREFYEGLAYVRQYYRSQWTPEWDSYFTTEWLSAQRKRYAQLRRRYAGVLGRETHELRQPSPEDLLRMTRQGPVEITLAIGAHLVAHQVLVYGQKDETLLVYYPDAQHSLRGITIRALKKRWLPEEGLICYGRAT